MQIIDCGEFGYSKARDYIDALTAQEGEEPIINHTLIANYPEVWITVLEFSNVHYKFKVSDI